MYNINFEVSAALLLSALLMSIYTKKRIKDRRNSLLSAMIWTTLISALFDIAMCWNSPINTGISRRLMIFFTIGYFVFHIGATVTYLLYNILLGRKDYDFSQPKNIVLIVPLIIDYVLIFLSIKFNIIFKVDVNGVYNRGNLIGIMYAIALFYIVLGIANIFTFRKNIPFQKRFASYALFFLGVIGLVIQYFYPEILIETFFSALGITILVGTVHNTEELTDSATGAFNKRAFIEVCSNKINSNMNFSVIVVYIDDFKLINKTFDAKYNEEIKVRIIDYLRNSFRNNELFRFTDSTFCIVYNKKYESHVENYLKTINKRFEKPWNLQKMSIKFSAHLCALKYKKDFNSIEMLLDYIEYIRTEGFKIPKKILQVSDLDISNRNRIREVKKLVRRALDEDEFSVVYQPIYSVEENRIISAEALVRLNDRSLGYISPEEFIPISEEDGSILKIGECVFEKVCRFLKTSSLSLLGIKYIEVNLSVVQCMENNLVQKLKRIMNTYNINPSEINLEITETAAANRVEMLNNNVIELNKLGIEFSLDDYGTGYSNMNYMLELPFKIVKIDKNIFWTALKDERAMVALESTIAMIKKLNLEIVVEGVETEKQLQKVKELECNYVQGNYFSRPLPMAEFKEYVINFNKRKQ